MPLKNVPTMDSMRNLNLVTPIFWEQKISVIEQWESFFDYLKETVF